MLAWVGTDKARGCSRFHSQFCLFFFRWMLFLTPTNLQSVLCVSYVSRISVYYLLHKAPVFWDKTSGFSSSIISLLFKWSTLMQLSASICILWPNQHSLFLYTLHIIPFMPNLLLVNTSVLLHMYSDIAHLTEHTSFILAFRNHISLPCSISICTHASYNPLRIKKKTSGRQQR